MSLLKRYQKAAEERRERERRAQFAPVAPPAPPDPPRCTNGKIHEWVYTGTGFRCDRCQKMAQGLKQVPRGKFTVTQRELLEYFPPDALYGQGKQRWGLVRDLVRVGGQNAER